MLLTIYSVGTIVKSSAKDNWFIVFYRTMFFNLPHLYRTSVAIAPFPHHTVGLMTTHFGHCLPPDQGFL